MLMPHLIVRHSRVMERDVCLVSARLHCHRHDGLGAFGSLRHPCVLDPARPIDLKEKLWGERRGSGIIVAG